MKVYLMRIYIVIDKKCLIMNVSFWWYGVLLAEYIVQMYLLTSSDRCPRSENSMSLVIDG